MRMPAVAFALLMAAPLMAAPLAAQVAVPDGYRMSDYDAPVPDDLPGAEVVDDDAAHALWRSGRVAFIDVMPDLPRPKALPADALWLGRARHSVPGAIWLPLAGFGALDAAGQVQFDAGLRYATGGDSDAPVLFLCRDACWMSWNAARRALEQGYTRVFWYPAGSTGWTFWDWPTERLKAFRP